eukprot:2294383-Alexandrium_andersonii.AAC.1
MAPVAMPSHHHGIAPKHGCPARRLHEVPLQRDRGKIPCRADMRVRVGCVHPEPVGPTSSRAPRLAWCSCPLSFRG